MKCCIWIDDDCANVKEYIDNDILKCYCTKQNDCNDFDPIWTDKDAFNAIKEYMENN